MFKYLAAFSVAFSPLLAADEATPQTAEQLRDAFAKIAAEAGSASFVPPEGWRMVPTAELPPNVVAMVVGTGPSDFPPSINLAVEPYKGSLKDYLKIVKGINDKRGDSWKDLGSVRTESGSASLSQVDSKSKWGSERHMHVIFLKDGNIYILTASALKNDFPRFYGEFFTALRSLKVN